MKVPTFESCPLCFRLLLYVKFCLTYFVTGPRARSALIGGPVGCACEQCCGVQHMCTCCGPGRAWLVAAVKRKGPPRDRASSRLAMMKLRTVSRGEVVDIAKPRRQKENSLKRNLCLPLLRAAHSTNSTATSSTHDVVDGVGVLTLRSL